MAIEAGRESEEDDAPCSRRRMPTPTSAGDDDDGGGGGGGGGDAGPLPLPLGDGVAVFTGDSLFVGGVGACFHGTNLGMVRSLGRLLRAAARRRAGLPWPRLRARAADCGAWPGWSPEGWACIRFDDGFEDWFRLVPESFNNRALRSWRIDLDFGAGGMGQVSLLLAGVE